MLLELRIGNLALAEDVVLPLGRGLTVLTGETGAGKSLVAGALSVLGGAKIGREIIRHGEELAWVEAICDLSAREDLRREVQRLGLPLGEDGLLVLRREMRREGRGRVLINGSLSSLSVLERLGTRLLTIQSQDQQRELATTGYARDLLDATLGLDGARQAVEQARQAWRKLRDELAARRQESEFARAQLEMWRYQHAELAAAALEVDEERELSEAIAVKQHARALQEAASLARAALEEGEFPARQSLGAALAALKPFTDKSPRLAGAEELLQTAADQAAEAASELERFLDGFQVDPRGLDELHERKALYEELRRKYHRDVHGLLALQDDLAARLDREGRADDELEQLADRVEGARRELEAACTTLHEQRCEGAPRAAAEALALIRPLALSRLELTFQVEPDSDDAGPVSVAGRTCRVSGHGADQVRLLARTNPGEAPGEVATIASGGEQSRIHLGLTVLRQRGLHPLLRLFDEVDAGLGMDAATPVALLLGRLAADAQAICITHLPTVAVHGHAHWRVDKLVSDGRTRVVLHHLGPEERVQEVARQLGGEGWREGDSAAQLTYARQLLHTVEARSVTGSGGHEDS